MVRLIVTSNTYRQSARITPEHQPLDPTNVYLARAPRFRVDAELVRDIALASSDSLDTSIGGPSVFPPLPDGLLLALPVPTIRSPTWAPPRIVGLHVANVHVPKKGLGANPSSCSTT